ncbi:PREDICTED: uncharacterized protein LOC109162669 [Ipomoea nil]|uniref:uncharacterized protein LOC109162669 n=1 Tax=Ipomoea nil TaxID=35883 RepID=UPI0009011E5D|nr:PREDICTED: uncharacterized protein LOC109162669 [Ipomoea nil]
MLISKYLDLKSDYDDMYFEYEANENDQLERVFWANGMTRKQYSVFGDVVSFDATYKTNRYSLVFVPFTGIDHHKKCVTFAAALIAREDVDSYCWVLRNFRNAMGSTPPLTITDQDPTVKVAIARDSQKLAIVTKEICAGCFECRVRAVTHGEAGNTYEVEDEHEIRYTVFVENGTRTTTCECRMYNRIGMLCSHAFAVLIYDRNEDIPPQHITPRWTRTALTNSPIKSCNDTLQRDNPTTRGNKEESNVLNTVYRCIAMAQGDVTKLEQISKALKEIESTCIKYQRFGKANEDD